MDRLCAGRIRSNDHLAGRSRQCRLQLLCASSPAESSLLQRERLGVHWAPNGRAVVSHPRSAARNDSPDERTPTRGDEAMRRLDRRARSRTADTPTFVQRFARAGIGRQGRPKLRHGLRRMPMGPSPTAPAPIAPDWYMTRIAPSHWWPTVRRMAAVRGVHPVRPAHRRRRLVRGGARRTHVARQTARRAVARAEARHDGAPAKTLLGPSRARRRPTANPSLQHCRVVGRCGDRRNPRRRRSAPPTPNPKRA